MNVLELPKVGFVPETFKPIVMRDVNQMRGRRTESRISGTPYWTASYQTQTQKLADIGVIDAFITELLAGAAFRAYDTTRPRPIEYLKGPLAGTRAGGGAFDGRGHLGSIVNPHSITVSQLPANFQLRRGDYVELRMSNLVASLHRITADVQANGSGTVTLSVFPAVDTQNFSAGGTLRARFEKPSCLMQIVGGSDVVRRQKGGRAASFSAQEVFFYEP